MDIGVDVCTYIQDDLNSRCTVGISDIIGATRLVKDVVLFKLITTVEAEKRSNL